MSEKRYQVVLESMSGHCCFEATVIDTGTILYDRPKRICECFDIEDVERIAAALNAQDEAGQ